MLKTRVLDLDVGHFQIVLNKEDAEDLGLHPQDRALLALNGERVVAIVDTTHSVVDVGEVGVSDELQRRLGVRDGVDLTVGPASRPPSVNIIKKKMKGQELSTEDVRTLVNDMVDGAVTDIELAAFVTSVQIHDMNMRETEDLTRAMVETGEVIDFGDEAIFDKHSIGGVPGNKITLLVVPIVAAAGLKIPKTSSRAITGPAGTADIMEVFCDIRLDAMRIKRITNQVGGVMAWGGAVNLAPADDIIIRAEYPLSLDPRSLLLASVLAKKRAVSAKNVVIDIPMGEGSKIATADEAKHLARDFIDLGARLGMNVECAITYGGQPVGKAIGPALEANEALAALRDEDAPESFIQKSTAIAGILLEMGGLARRGQGMDEADRLLKNGSAYEKFVEIVQAQGGDEPDTILIGDHQWHHVSTADGYISAVKNRAIVALARACGSPKDTGAGVVLHKKRGDRVEEGEPLLTLYSENESKLESARSMCSHLGPVQVEGMLLERVPDYREITTI